MLSKHQQQARNQLIAISLDDLVPEDHLVRKIDKVINFDFIYPLVEHTYSHTGRPSVDPVVLIKLVLIQYLFGIRSMRQTIKEVETNMAYRWFLGYDFNQKIPHFSTFGKNYVRRFAETEVFEHIFYRILKQAMEAGLVDPDVAFVDSNHVKANANKHKFHKKLIRKETRVYQEVLEDEINVSRVAEGKKPFARKESQEEKESKISDTDPESGYYVKGEREKQFAYSFHTACDTNGFILGSIVTPGNIHDSQQLIPLIEKLKNTLSTPLVVVADAGYKTPIIAKYLWSQGIEAVLPYTRPKGKEGLFSKRAFLYDHYLDSYLCPNEALLSYVRTTRDGYRLYKSNSLHCSSCALLKDCTQNKQKEKMILRHLWEPYLEVSEELRYTEQHKKWYRRRKETIERCFADAKEKHGMRWTTYRGLAKVTLQAMLTFAAMNLKKMANWLWKKAVPFYFFDFKQKKTVLLKY
ncbi:IS1182 family transposase [Listeria monocytogenes]|uniref:IS1182 family transposase n=1 Tax=Listeria monocytogenes TaxID=1639 RepID=UPI00085BB20B|nr:IS1182 family transposase [Listeria monocytogenes]EAC2537357.1 IS1182 family transposase [Listeria monocytogenes]EAC2539864.1 IS1182 family transposase [Listeria monocytogenes]EAC3202867.1 IS1182 family transposase [Listeria monocytogenes]EAC3205227.1 IS1182 family transposase [Listeria monocytogenes]EAC5769793.1 IS1182 family transposase [Listeria monocytogenes]